MTSTNSTGQPFYINWLKNTFSRVISSSGKVPKHVAFIMDGNRRFAKRNNMEVREGHMAGFLSMNKVLELCYECGVTTATVFAFSVENFKRSAFEVNSLMELAKDRIKQITNHSDLAEKFGIRVVIVGDKSLLPDDVLQEVKRAEDATRNNNKALLNICIPYSGRGEILDAMKGAISEIEDGSLETPTEIDEDILNQHMCSTGSQSVDLLIRTSKVSRLSDFLIWQVSKKGVVIEFLECLWPEFGPVTMAWILIKFAFRKTYENLADGDYEATDEDRKMK
ncbi:HER003Cp [Eremothecium sinecaudum]|uniref:Alkyl transferase n=1 Tax=Eremothecium sinecaudum TaxID=45286 RepID=A0A0X8HTP9_9SACH|nr:HER003Cp [Eremothecium sinecaudum]AMD21282.1 HER003Cp [Eremothecium sinecaudum]